MNYLNDNGVWTDQEVAEFLNWFERTNKDFQRGKTAMDIIRDYKHHMKWQILNEITINMPFIKNYHCSTYTRQTIDDIVYEIMRDGSGVVAYRLEDRANLQKYVKAPTMEAAKEKILGV